MSQTNNFGNICRTCSQTTDLISLHENIYLIEMLETSTQIQIQLNDELPKNICLNCVKLLNETYEFVHKCRSNDAALKQKLTREKLLNSRKIYEKINMTSSMMMMPITTPMTTATTTTSTTLFNEEIFFKTETTEMSDVDYDSLSEEETNEIEQSIIEPMELNENSYEDPIDVTSSGALPEKSQARYKRERTLFLTYCKQNNLNEITEPVLMNYFEDKSKTLKAASSLWSLYSMLKSTLMLDDNVDISKYPKLLAFLKAKNHTYKPVVSKGFTRNEVDTFLSKAPDETYLLMKVVMIMGIAGGCMRDELMRMTVDDIEDKGSVLIITIPVPNTSNARTFLITNREPRWLKIYRKYYTLRAQLYTENKRLFIYYKNGRFGTTTVGINTFGRIPKLIAEYLNLPEPSQYTGHCFRRTSTTFNKRCVWKMDGASSQL